MIQADILKAGEKQIKEILTAVKAGKFQTAYDLLWDTPQPIEWIQSEKSDLVKPGGEYRYNEIALIENLGKRIFEVFEFEIQSFSRVQDRSKFSSNIVVILHHAFKGEPLVRKKWGLASVASGSHAHLTVSDPMAFSNAKKSAAKQLGAFFGLNLNRTLENLDFIPTTQVERGESGAPTDDEYSKAVAQISGAPTREDAHDIMDKSGFRWKLTYDPAVVNIINSKSLKNNQNGQNKESAIIGS